MDLTSFLKNYRKQELVEAEEKRSVGRPKKSASDSKESAHEKVKTIAEIQNKTKRIFEVGGPLHGIVNYKIEDSVLAGKKENKDKDFIANKYGVQDDADEASFKMMVGGELTDEGKKLTPQDLMSKLNAGIRILNQSLDVSPISPIVKMGSNESMLDEFFDKASENFNALTLLYRTHIEAKKHAGQTNKEEKKFDPTLIDKSKQQLFIDTVDLEKIFNDNNTPHDVRTEIKKHINEIKTNNRTNVNEKIIAYLSKEADKNQPDEVSKYGVSPRGKLSEPEEEPNWNEEPDLNVIQKVKPEEDYTLLGNKKVRNLPKNMGKEAVNAAIGDEKPSLRTTVENKEKRKKQKVMFNTFMSLIDSIKGIKKSDKTSEERKEIIKQTVAKKEEPAQERPLLNTISRNDISRKLMNGFGFNVGNIFSSIKMEDGEIVALDKNGKKFTGSITIDNKGVVKVSR